MEKLRPLPGRHALLLCILIAFASCKKEVLIQTLSSDDAPAATNYFNRFWLDTSYNRLYLNDTIHMTISGNTITGRIPYYTDLSTLIPSFETPGAAVTVNDSLQYSGITPQNFKKHPVYTVTGKDGAKTAYTVNLVNFTGLPVVKIKTAAAVTSRETYVKGSVTIDGAGQYDDLGEVTMQIKGHGGTTWGNPKNPYRIKFDSKTAVLGEPKAKDWLLIANYFDKTMLRNAISLYMGQLSNLDWTPHGHFAEVFMNEVYIGTYLVTEKIETGSNRVNVGDNGYVLEIDQISKLAADDVFFQTMGILCTIKNPTVSAGDEKYNYIKNFVSAAEIALYSPNFTDTLEGYNKYLDVNSFVDWYLINEITKNNDAIFYSSCYMNLKPGGKLKMGPIWDFDIAMGNVYYNNNQDYTGFWIRNAVWINRLFEDPAFEAKVKARFRYFKSKEDAILAFINKNAADLKWSVIENNNKYNTLYNYTFPNYAIWGSYDNEVLYMKTWLHNRIMWLDQAFATTTLPN
ncbi:CotH kinase family protein [Chitinophaga sp.]|uniref:CotH kinase family protein n=1 Tax=Chitinophaga sp. TaxID=1869181 RepID=UPI0031E22074